MRHANPIACPSSIYLPLLFLISEACPPIDILPSGREPNVLLCGLTKPILSFDAATFIISSSHPSVTTQSLLSIQTYGASESLIPLFIPAAKPALFSLNIFSIVTLLLPCIACKNLATFGSLLPLSTIMRVALTLVWSSTLWTHLLKRSGLS